MRKQSIEHLFKIYFKGRSKAPAGKLDIGAEKGKKAKQTSR